MIVQLAAHRDTLGTRNKIGAGASVRENLHRNARLIHRLQTPLANLGKEFKGIGTARGQCSLPESAAADGSRIDAAGQRRNCKMLLECDGAHGASSDCSPVVASLPSSGKPHENAPLVIVWISPAISRARSDEIDWPPPASCRRVPAIVPLSARSGRRLDFAGGRH